jgi:hypothetical protein
MEDRPVQLLDCVTDATVEAVLRTRLSAQVVVATEVLWNPHRQAIPEAEHSHWDWSLKVGRLAIPGARIMGIECRGALEAMSFVLEQGKLARLPPALGLPLLYIDILEAAPWNLRRPGINPRFRGLGPTLMVAAVRLSELLGYEGRIGLHSLEQAEDFYRRACQMSELGPDRGYYGLVYFEWTAEHAQRYAEEAGL